MGAVEKAIQNSELGLNPGNDGQLIRVPIPPLNEERRREYARLVKRYAEGAHVAVRNIRREQMDRIKTLEKEKKISADEARRRGEQLQKLADRYIGLVDQVAARKDAEIMEVCRPKTTGGPGVLARTRRHHHGTQQPLGARASASAAEGAQGGNRGD